MFEISALRRRIVFSNVFAPWLAAGVIFLALTGCAESKAAQGHTPGAATPDAMVVAPPREPGPALQGRAHGEESAVTPSQRAQPPPDYNDHAPHDVPAVQQEDSPLVGEGGTQVLHNHYIANDNIAPPPLEERILKSEVIVLAQLLSAQSPDVLQLLMAGKPVPSPILTTYRFKALEYLKGAGPAEFELVGKTSNGNDDWDDGEALLFLNSQKESSASSAAASSGSDSPPQAFVFASVHEDHPDQYTINSRNPVWLPAAGAASVAAEGVQRASEETTYATDWDRTHSPYELHQKMATMTGQEIGEAIRNQGFVLDLDAGQPTGFMTLQEVTARIKWVKGDGTPEYDYCVERSINYLKHYRDVAAYFGEARTPQQSEKDFVPGSPGGSVVVDYGTIRERGYPKNFLTGEDAELFQGQIVDDNDDPTDGFKYQIINRRPLPFGNYAFTNHSRRHEFNVCGFAPVNNQLSFVVSATAPAGALHEAFFDPVAIGQGVGANATNGVLKPMAITAQGYAATVKSLVWQDKKVIMTLSPYVSLLGQTLDFIALDGTVSLSLEAKSATVDASAGTYTWSQATRPWNAGDRLMLRLHGPTVSIMDASGPEGKEVEFQVALSEAVDHEVRVSWKPEFYGSVQNYALATEYWHMSGELVFQPGQTSRSAEIYLNDDDWRERDEVFLVILSNPKGATIADGEGIMTIIDDD
ncbi:MAG: hypothetical protein F4X64_13395 [Chloroflexi bacterium]|nr:hypothetical protein [Chloroflexota bacterium]